MFFSERSYWILDQKFLELKYPIVVISKIVLVSHLKNEVDRSIDWSIDYLLDSMMPWFIDSFQWESSPIDRSTVNLAAEREIPVRDGVSTESIILQNNCDQQELLRNDISNGFAVSSSKVLKKAQDV